MDANQHAYIHALRIIKGLTQKSHGQHLLLKVVNLIFGPEMNPKSTHVEQKQGCK